MTGMDGQAPTSAATDAVLVKSDEMPPDAQKVEELDFNKIKGPITAEHLLLGMKNMGFQASAMAEAVRIINDMVLKHVPHERTSPVWLDLTSSTHWTDIFMI
jgi:deoxyhypusine synthase